MPIQSDITINVGAFDPAATPKATAELNENLQKTMAGGLKWYEVGAAKYREMRWKGETVLPRPVVIESGKNIKLPSRDGGREIPCRMFQPETGSSKGIFLHFHGGGFVLNTEEYQDVLLKFLADEIGVTAISVGYRLAPEDPFPAGPDDCIDVAEHLLKQGDQYGGKLLFMGGESAGGHLTAAVAFELLRRHTEPLPLKGLIFHYGVFDITHSLPAIYTFNKSLVLDMEIIFKFREAYAPGTTMDQLRDPRVSPIFEQLNKFRGRLPPAVFTVGTEDPLLDDTLLMSMKWMAAGGGAVVKIYPGAAHGFTMFDPKLCEASGQARDVVQEFLLEKLQA